MRLSEETGDGEAFRHGHLGAKNPHPLVLLSVGYQRARPRTVAQRTGLQALLSLAEISHFAQEGFGDAAVEAT